MIKEIIQRLFDIHPDAMSFKQGLDLTGLPIITLHQKITSGDKEELVPYNFILDTGSDVSVIDSNVLPKIEHELLKNMKGSLYGIDGNKTLVDVCSITLCYKDNLYKHDFLVRDLGIPFKNVKEDHGVTLHGMIGSRFFNQYKYVLDFAELIAYSKK